MAKPVNKFKNKAGKTVTETEIVAAAASVAVSTNFHNLAVDLAHTFDDNAALQEQVETNIDAMIAGKETPMSVMFALKEAFGDDFARFPRPGSTDGNNPGMIPVKKPGKDGVEKVEPGSWYKYEFVPSTVRGKGYLDEIKEVEAELKNEASALPRDTLQGEKADATAKFNAVVSMVERAVLLSYLLDDIDGMPLVNAEFILDRDGGPRGGTKPLYVQSAVKGEGTKFKIMSIGSFLRFDVAEAKANGGTYDALIKTLERTATPGKSKDYKIENVDNFEACLPEWNTFVRSAIKDTKVHTSLVKDLTDDEAYLDSLIEGHDLFDRLMQSADIQQLVARRMAKRKAS